MSTLGPPWSVLVDGIAGEYRPGLAVIYKFEHGSPDEPAWVVGRIDAMYVALYERLTPVAVVAPKPKAKPGATTAISDGDLDQRCEEGQPSFAPQPPHGLQAGRSQTLKLELEAWVELADARGGQPQDDRGRDDHLGDDDRRRGIDQVEIAQWAAAPYRTRSGRRANEWPSSAPHWATAQTAPESADRSDLIRTYRPRSGTRAGSSQSFWPSTGTAVPAAQIRLFRLVHRVTGNCESARTASQTGD